MRIMIKEEDFVRIPRINSIVEIIGNTESGACVSVCHDQSPIKRKIKKIKTIRDLMSFNGGEENE